MKPLSVRVRLTLWYASILAFALLGFAFIVLSSLQRAIQRTVDNQLHEHMTAVRGILHEDANHTPDALRHDLNEDAELAPDLTFLKIWDSQGHVIYSSAAIARLHLSNRRPVALAHPVTRSSSRYPFRVLVQSAATSFGSYIILIAVPIGNFVVEVQEVKSTFWILIPLLLLVAIAGGYWIAARALSPVLTMIAAADAIHSNDLAARLQVPEAKDELQRLAITLNRMLERLQAGMERITRFTADASHELRTPIALLRTRAEVLLRRQRTNDEYRNGLQTSLRELERTSVLLEQMLLLARADAGAETLHFTKGSLNQVLTTTAESLQTLAQVKNLSWSIVLPPDSVDVNGDAAALHRLFIILIDNAIKYTPEGGSVTIRLRATDEQAIAEITDTGIGINSADLPHVFDRFYRADQARSRANGGAGLGLSIGLWIVQKHGGTITAESTPSVGSEFRVVLPRA